MVEDPNWTPPGVEPAFDRDKDARWGNSNNEDTEPRPPSGSPLKRSRWLIDIKTVYLPGDAPVDNDQKPE